MKTVLSQESKGTLPEGREKMVVTILYPDAAYGAQLVAAFQRAVASLGELEALDPRPWRLDVLQWPEMQAEATRDVACSRVVVVPADDAYANSEFFRRWVEAWPTVPDARRLLLVPRRRAGEMPPQVQQFVQWLQGVCAQKGMDFTEGEMTEGPTPSAASQSGDRQPRGGFAAEAGRGTLAAYLLEGGQPADPRCQGLNK